LSLKLRNKNEDYRIRLKEKSIYSAIELRPLMNSNEIYGLEVC